MWRRRSGAGMSVKVMGAVWELQLPPGHKIVMLALADHADHDGRNVHPGVDLIAWKTGYSPRQVQAILRALESQGLIERTDHIAGGRGHTTHYRIAVQAGTGSDRLKGADFVPICPEKGGVKGEASAPFSNGKGEAKDADFAPFSGVDDEERVKFATGKGEVCDIAFMRHRL
jgi:hypothetical protein